MITKKTILLAISALLLSFDSASSLHQIREGTKRATIERTVLKRVKPISRNDLADSLHISRDTVKFELRRLVRLGKLKKIGAGCNTKYLRSELVPAYNDRMKGVWEIERARRAVNNSRYKQTSSTVCHKMEDAKFTTTRSSLSLLHQRNKILRELKCRNAAAEYSRLEPAPTYRPISGKRIPTIALMERVVVSSDVPLTKGEIITALKDVRIINCNTANSALRRLVEGGKIKKDTSGQEITYSKLVNY